MLNNAAYHIIFIDDEPNILKLYSAILRNNGFEVTEFTEAQEAIRFLQQTNKTVDLIIADVNMPEMSGMQFLEHIKKIPKFSSIPLIFLSALSDGAIQMNAFDLGAVDYLTKPVKKELFLSKIRALLQSYSLKKMDDIIFQEGTKQEKEIDEIISICETEKLTGYVILYHRKDIGILYFAGGMLEKIEYDEYKDADAFEKLTQWKDYYFAIFNGSYDEGFVKQFLRDKLGQEDTSQPIESRDSANKTIEGSDGIIEAFSFSGDLQEEIIKIDNLQYSVVYELFAGFTKTITNILRQNPLKASIEFTDKKFLRVHYDPLNQLTLFKNKKMLPGKTDKNERT